MLKLHFAPNSRAGRIDSAAYRHDGVPGDCNVAHDRRCASPVDEGSAADQKVNRVGGVLFFVEFHG